MVSAIRYVKKAFIAKGSGIIDFEREIKKIKPDVFVVNNDGDVKEKRVLCKSLGIRYVVLKRSPAKGLPVRSTTNLRRGFR